MEPPRPAKILVVDDMREIAQMIRLILEEKGYDVEVAYDGQAALTAARSRPPDLVICDVVMPTVMGWELCRKLKEDADPRPLPVIILTAKATELDEVRSYESNADDHLTKPIDFEALLSSVGRQLAAHKGTP